MKCAHCYSDMIKDAALSLDWTNTNIEVSKILENTDKDSKLFICPKCKEIIICKEDLNK